jgi:dipeptidyl aminopeptidase/acylaminoacyl peptidase
MIGHSYGGTMAAFAVGKTSRFAAIVCSAPVTDQISEQGTESDPSYPDEWFTGVPWIHFEDAWRQSPLV